MTDNPHMLPKVRSEGLLREIATHPCSLRLASFLGLPCAPRNTVVPCHLPVIGKGIATKVSDLFVVAGCQTCHDLLDLRHGKGGFELRERYPRAYMERLLFALCETQARLIGSGHLLIVPGHEVIQ